MAKLEELGYITQPHTSAGRVPTEKGYRYYVDTLLKEHSLSLNSALSDKLFERFSIIKKDDKILIKEVAKTLSSVSHYVAIATPPKIENIIFQRIKFIRYEKNKVLTILVFKEGILNNRIIELDNIYTQKQLDNAANYLNNRFSGLTIKKVREKIAYQMYKEKKVCNELIAGTLTICKDISISSSDNFLLNELSGTCNLPDFATMKQIKEILRAIEDKNFMLKLLNQISNSKGIKVFVGMENILPSMKELSMVVSTYRDKKYACGAIGIIGPTRMNYRKMIPIVDHTAKALTQILSNT
jgi:heat-inducible transcriptional repressor